MAKKYFVNIIDDHKFFVKMGLDQARYTVIGLFDSNVNDGDGSAMGWYAHEYFLDTHLIACGIQSGIHTSVETDSPFILVLSREKPKKYKKIEISSIYHTKYILAETDEEAVSAFEYLSRTEGIIPAIESAHAVAYARKLAPSMDRDQIIVINISGRGDKDVAAIARYRGVEIYE